VLYLATSIAQPTAGKPSEDFGPRCVFLADIVTVLTGGLLGGFAQDLAEVVVARPAKPSCRALAGRCR
jgi:hypothetical protein